MDPATSSLGPTSPDDGGEVVQQEPRLQDLGSQTLLSLALRVPERTSWVRFGHQVAYQRKLVQVSEGRGATAAVVVPGRTDADIPGLIPLGSRTRHEGWVDGLGKLLEERLNEDVTVLVYEGSQELVMPIVRLATHYPRVVFILNLFSMDPELTVPRLSERSIVGGLHLGSATPLAGTAAAGEFRAESLPHNIVLYADTVRRALLAGSLGFRDVKVWPLYSVLTPVAARRDVSEGMIRVVIPVAGWQVSRQLVYEVANVVKLCHRYAGVDQHFDWYAFGGGYGGHWRRRRAARLMRGLRKVGVRFDSEGLSELEYARILAEADVVWLPKRGLYTTQSSGKAADALTSGTPLLAPNGSFPAYEQERWVPGAPAYTGVREAVEVLLRSRSVWPTVRSRLADQLEEIRWWYSPDRAVDELFVTASNLRAELETSPGPVDAFSVEEPATSDSTDENLTRTFYVRLQGLARARLEHLRASGTEVWVRLGTLVRIR